MTFAPPAPPVKRGSKITCVVLIVVGAVSVLCCVFGIVGTVYIYRMFNSEMAPAQNAARHYMDDVVAGSYRAAYWRTCDKVHQRLSEDDYFDLLSAQPRFSSYLVGDTNVKTRDTTATATVTFRLVRADNGKSVNQAVILLKERGQWRVCE